MPSDELFGLSSSSEAMLAVTSDRNWVAAMLQVEAALARAEAKVGLVPARLARTIEVQCSADAYDIGQIAREAVRYANPVVPLVTAIRAKLDPEAAAFVHLGATSQDVLDTAMMLMARQVIDLVLDELNRAADAAAVLADRHRTTVMAGRTLMQQALPMTFGLKAAGWLVAIVDAHRELTRVRSHRLAIQFGGGVGTLASLADKGLEVTRALAAELDLSEPVVPWHTARARVVDVANALGTAAGVAGKVALDVVLMAQTEIGEVSEGSTGGEGGSSTLPQKRNPVQAIEILAAVRGVNAQVSLLHGTVLQEHERGAGSWQAEWAAVREVFRFAGGTTARLADLLSGLRLDPGRMRQNLESSGGLIMAESVVTALGKKADPMSARQLVEAAVSASVSSGRRFADVIGEDENLRRHMNEGELQAALDPTRYLGVSDSLIDRAIVAYRRQRKEKHD